MPVEMGMWRMDGDRPQRLVPSPLPTELMLEEFLSQDPSLLGERLLVIGRQVRTPQGKYIDLLAIDADGNLHVLELKRDRSPRDVVAQILDYGSWVTELGREEIVTRANEKLDTPFETAFESTFGSPVPDEINGMTNLTIVATDLDDSSERIVTYLRGFGVPINAVFFSFLADGDRRYLARSWLASEDYAQSGGSVTAKKREKVAPWNGVDWYVNFGDGEGRAWTDGRKYGFVSAGGGKWYSQTLRNLPVGARVNVYLPQRGYVAVGEVLRAAEQFARAEVWFGGGWVGLADQELNATYEEPVDRPGDEDVAEYVVPVRWLTAVPASDAFREPGLFASQHSACKLRQQFTLERLADHFGLTDHDDSPDATP